jgi:hypothetical protein
MVDPYFLYLIDCEWIIGGATPVWRLAACWAQVSAPGRG